MPTARALVVALLMLSGCSSGGHQAVPSVASASPTPEVTTASPSPAGPTPSPAPTATVPASPTPQRPSTAPTPHATIQPTPGHTRSRAPAPRPTTPPPSGTTPDISEVAVYRFSPMTLTIKSGDKVRVTNQDTAAHTFTGRGFDSGNMAAGAVYSYRFTTPGTFNFVCTYHESLGMTGTVTVSR